VASGGEVPIHHAGGVVKGNGEKFVRSVLFMTFMVSMNFPVNGSFANSGETLEY
jgi:hypothetical protein